MFITLSVRVNTNMVVHPQLAAEIYLFQSGTNKSRICWGMMVCMEVGHPQASDLVKVNKEIFTMVMIIKITTSVLADKTKLINFNFTAN